MHRAQKLLTFLPTALQYGMAEPDPECEREPLRVSKVILRLYSP